MTASVKKLNVGLTGGIGSGKSLVSGIFYEQHGIEVVDADLLAREVVAADQPALHEIAGRYGKGILLPDGHLNRRQLREVIFASAEEKVWLEQLLHPLINNLATQRLASASSPYAILASPLLLEGSQARLVDRVLVIDATEEQQLLRARQRDGSSAEAIEAIMRTQLSREARLARADDVIRNTGSPADLDEQVRKLHHFYLSLAGAV